MGEIAEMFDVNPSLIRYWESKFSILSPGKNTSGKRAFTVKDIENLKVIYHLVKEKGMTLEGAQKQLRENRSGIKRDMEIVERLNSIRSTLMEIRQELADGEPSIDSDIEEYVAPQVVVESAESEEFEVVKVAEIASEPEELFELHTDEELESECEELEEYQEGCEQSEAEMFPQSVAHPQSVATQQQQALFDAPMTNNPAEEYAPQPRVVEQSLF